MAVMSTVEPIQANSAPSIDVAVGKRIHTLMWDQRIKNKEIAELLGIDPTAVGKKLRAEQKFSIEQLSLVAARLDTTIGYLVGEHQGSRPTPLGGGSLLVMPERGPYRARTDDIHGGIEQVGALDEHLAPVTPIRKAVA